jgi:hypothetical protein
MGKRRDTRSFLSDPAYLADLNGAFVITERVDDDLLLTLNFGGGASSLLMLDGFFASNAGPGFGPATTPDGILDDEAAVPILSALFGRGGGPNVPATS